MKPNDIKTLADVAVYPEAVGLTDSYEGLTRALLWHEAPLVENGKTFDCPVMVIECNKEGAEELTGLLSDSHSFISCVFMNIMFNDENDNSDFVALPVNVTLWTKNRPVTEERLTEKFHTIMKQRWAKEDKFLDNKSIQALSSKALKGS